MNALEGYNPKLHKLLSEKPESVLEFKDVITENTGRSAEIAEAAATAAEAAAERPPKVFTLPIFWGWMMPVFKVTASWLVAIQAATHIPWLPFIVASAFSVRLFLLPFMI